MSFEPRSKTVLQMFEDGFKLAQGCEKMHNPFFCMLHDHQICVVVVVLVLVLFLSCLCFVMVVFFRVEKAHLVHLVHLVQVCASSK